MLAQRDGVAIGDINGDDSGAEDLVSVDGNALAIEGAFLSAIEDYVALAMFLGSWVAIGRLE